MRNRASMASHTHLDVTMSDKPQEPNDGPKRIRLKRTCRRHPNWVVWTAMLLIVTSGQHKCPLSTKQSRVVVVGMACAAAVATDDDESSQSPSRDLGSNVKVRSVAKDNTTSDSSHSVPANATGTLSTGEIFVKAAKRGLGGGLPGAFAGIVQVLGLMWLRTIINYQIRYGVSFAQAFVFLKNDGGIARFYQGVGFALIQAPVSRFVSTAANDGVNAFMASLQATKEWGPERTTLIASVVVGMARIILQPIDTCKTVLQINSVEGFRSLMRRVRAGKIGVLYQGSLATAVAAFVGHYPWFYTFNLLSSSALIARLITSTLLRNAAIGFVSSIVSDVTVNSIRVIKTTKQSMGTKTSATYMETISVILASGGWKGLFGRGLRTRIVANALQSVVFTVIWRGLVERKSR